MVNKELPLCECGCGEPVAKIGNRFIHGHNGRGVPLSPERCAKLGRYERTPEMNANMSNVLKSVPHTPEWNAAVSVAKTGVSRKPFTPEHCEAMSTAHKESDVRAAKSKANKESDAVKANTKAMIGGDDIVGHHYIYDHSDLLKYTMKMTRSRHTRLHHNMRKSGTIVPHINMVV